MLTVFRSRSREDGFTLVELLIVVVIIGILAAVAIPIFLNQQVAAVKATMKADVRNMQIAMQTYLINHPDATNLEWRWESGTQTKALASDADWQKYKVVPSRPETLLLIRKAFTSTSGPGSAQGGYVLLAANSSITSDGSYYYYRWDSSTGQYFE